MDRLSEIKVPTLVIHSEKDYTPLEHKKYYVNEIPNAKLCIIPEAGHIVNCEKPEEYNNCLKNFLLENR